MGGEREEQKQPVFINHRYVYQSLGDKEKHLPPPAFKRTVPPKGSQ